MMNSAGPEIIEQDSSNYLPSSNTTAVGIVGSAHKGEFGAVYIASEGDLIQNFGEPTAKDYGLYAALLVLRKSGCVWFSRAAHDHENLKQATAGTLVPTPAEEGKEEIPADNIQFKSKTADSTINGYKVVVKKESIGGNDFYSVELMNPKGNKVVESIQALSLDKDSDRYLPNFINKYSNYMICQVNDNFTLSDSIELTFAGGQDGIDGLTKDDIIEAAQVFSNEESVDLSLLIAPGWTDLEVVTNSITISEKRKDSLSLIDIPFGLTPQKAVDWTNGTGDYAGNTALNSDYAAVYYPWLKTYDKYTKTDIWLPPTAFTAAQIAYSDSISAVWSAPAGTSRGKIQEAVTLERSLGKNDRDLLYGNRNVINPIVNFRGKGTVVWGQKTTQRTPTATDRINVRRLINYIRKMVLEATLDYTFEPNETLTYGKWEDMIEPKLLKIKSDGGIYDYKLSMGEEVTAIDVENHIMPGKISIKPTKTAEYIPITLEVASYTTQLSED